MENTETQAPRKMETLLTTTVIGEAINTARELHKMSVAAGETAAANMIYVTETDTGLDDDGFPTYTFQVVASTYRPRRTVIFENGEAI
jgi:hypothetical protein